MGRLCRASSSGENAGLRHGRKSGGGGGGGGPGGHVPPTFFKVGDTISNVPPPHVLGVG